MENGARTAQMCLQVFPGILAPPRHPGDTQKQLSDIVDHNPYCGYNGIRGTKKNSWSCTLKKNVPNFDQKTKGNPYYDPFDQFSRLRGRFCELFQQFKSFDWPQFFLWVTIWMCRLTENWIGVVSVRNFRFPNFRIFLLHYFADLLLNFLASERYTSNLSVYHATLEKKLRWPNHGQHPYRPSSW